MSVLVADADPFNLRLLSELCAAMGHEVITAGDGEAVMAAVARQPPLLVVMDAALPGTTGLEVLRVLKADAELMQIPVLLALTDEDAAGRRTALELGAADYLTRPYRVHEIQQRVRTVLRLQAARGRSVAPARASRSSLDADLGLGTTGQLHISLDYEYTRAVRYHHPLSCVVIRCANLAAIDAELGGLGAERLMVPLAAALRGCIRGVDQLFRSGPDEFTVLLPETAARGCAVVVARIEGKLGEPGLIDLPTQPDLCVGAASMPHEGIDDAESLRRRAARAAAG